MIILKCKTYFNTCYSLNVIHTKTINYFVITIKIYFIKTVLKYCNILKNTRLRMSFLFEEINWITCDVMLTLVYRFHICQVMLIFWTLWQWSGFNWKFLLFKGNANNWQYSRNIVTLLLDRELIIKLQIVSTLENVSNFPFLPSPFPLWAWLQSFAKYNQ